MHAIAAQPAVGLRNTRAGIVALMFSYSVMSYFDRTIMSIAGPSIIKEFRLSETEMGVVYSAFILSYALLMIPGGHLADRFGPRLVLSVMGLGAAAFTALTALAGSSVFHGWLGVIPSFVLIRLAMGVVTSPLYPACGRMNANWLPLTQRARAQGIVVAGAGVGGALSPILFSRLIAAYGWRTAFYAAALATAALAAVWHWYARDYPPKAEPKTGLSGLAGHSGPPGEWRQLFANRNLVLLTAGYFALDYFEYIFFYWLYYYLGEIRKLGAAQSAVYTTVLFVAWMVMSPLRGWVSDRLVRRYGRSRGLRIVPMIGLVTSAALLFLAVNTESIQIMVGLLSLSLGFASAAEAPFWTAAIEAGGNRVGAACGIFNSGGNVGGFLAPIVTPWIASRAGWSWGLYFGCGMVLVATAVWPFVDLGRQAEGQTRAGG
ncbi:MAG: MFS transporter [Acidobacteria bacterium]|nr:MFS transporter [Acidobacteriota bacterium]